MRPTVVLLSASDSRPELESRLRRAGSYQAGDIFDRLEIGECRFGVDLSGDVLADYDEGEILEISKRIGEFSAILLEYSGVACVRRLLEEILPGLDGLLDTNYGEIIEYEEVLANFSRDEAWDWTSSGMGDPTSSHVP